MVRKPILAEKIRSRASRWLRMLNHPDGKLAAFFRTEVTIGVGEMLKVLSDRWTIEEQFHNVRDLECR